MIPSATPVTSIGHVFFSGLRPFAVFFPHPLA